MNDVPIAFSLAVIVNRITGEGIRCFSTVSEENEVRQLCREGEMLLGIFPMVLGMTEMEKFEARPVSAKVYRSIFSKFFSAGFQEGIREGEARLRKQVRPHLDELVWNLETMKALEAQINDAMASMKNPE